MCECNLSNLSLPYASNKQNYKTLLLAHWNKLLTEDISLHILRGKEEDFYDLEKFRRFHKIPPSDFSGMLECVQKVLIEHGYNIYLGFGETGLFIYTSEERPNGAY